MKTQIQYRTDKASASKLAEHLQQCDADFVPPLSERIAIVGYANKLSVKATRFEAWLEDKLIGLVAAYCNDQESRHAFISSVSVLHTWQGKGIADSLLKLCLAHAEKTGMRRIDLEVAADNKAAIALYKRNGFSTNGAHERFITMTVTLQDGGQYGKQA
ncbi:MAG: GNAT family N-acetyltransferase [Gammaproteobacteria bacterium]|nr:GNAT family N-acetyltransferase [Gammaproteobacteria bacterium]MBU1623774.1 GNAT family N-acetyltransferase [Gammaproteobacteria bacterium]